MNQAHDFDPSDELIRISEEFLEQLRHDPSLSIAEFAARYPSCSDEIQRYLPIVLSMEKQTVAEGNSSTASPRPLPIPADVLPIGLSRYRIRRLIGSGSMGAVYEAHDLELDRNVALKIPQLAQATRHIVDRFYREARAMATVDHPNICSIFDVGEIRAEDLDHAELHLLVGQPYLTMALVEGHSLADLLKERAWDCLEAAQLVGTIASALESAHQAGVVHRDIKPSNIVIDERGYPIVMDFGLARRDQPEEIEITVDGQIVGSPAYMSPEQINCRRLVGPSSDIYSLGVVLYELVCGKRPFIGSQLTLLRDICWVEPPNPSAIRDDIDPRMEAICLKAIAKAPEDRYATAAAFASDLRAYIEGNTGTIVAKPRRRQLVTRGPLAAGFAVCVALAFVLTWPSLGSRRDVAPDPPAPNGNVSPTKPVPVAISEAPLKQALRDAFVQHFADRAFETREPDISATYQLLFAEHGLSPEDTSANDLQDLLAVQSEAVRTELLLGLESWLCCLTRETEDVPTPWLRSLLRYAHTEHTPIRSAILELDKDRLSVMTHQYTTKQYDPRLSVIWYLYLRRNDKENARTILAHALEAYPDNAWVHAAEGLRRQGNGNHVGAEKSFRRALEDNPSPYLLTHLAVCLQNQKKHDAAIEVVKQAIDLAPDYGTAHFTLGKSYYLKQDYEAADATLSTAIALKTNFMAQAHRHQALARAKLGRMDEAMESSRLAIGLFRSRRQWRNLSRLCQAVLNEMERQDEHGWPVHRYHLAIEYHNANRELRQMRKAKPYLERVLADLESAEANHNARINRLKRILALMDRLKLRVFVPR